MTRALDKIRRLARTCPMVSLIDLRDVPHDTLWDLVGTSQINLHRHDYPAGMTPEEKAAALVYQGSYYNAVSLRSGR